MVLLALGAAGGGYYLAKSNSPAERLPVQAARVEEPQKPRLAKRAVPKMTEKKRAAKREEKSRSAIAKPAAPAPKAPAKRRVASGLGADMETAMLERADILLRSRDLDAARMVFVYLARHGSAGAMTRLAQTYDPQYLQDNRFDLLRNSDLARAKRLYGAAVSMGDEAAAARLKELP